VPVQLNNDKKCTIKNPIILLTIVGIVSLGIRIYYFTPEIPVTLDAFGYFFYAFDAKVIGHLPENYSIANNGWPSFLWAIFSGFEFDNLLSYMQIQRFVSILFSVLTIIPVYFTLLIKFSQN